MAIVIKNINIPNKMSVSIQTCLKPTPLIITERTIMKNHFAGTILEITLNGKGMFSIGNINPLNMTVGRNIPMREINIADCWEAVEEEINNPNDKATSVNKMLSAIKSDKSPTIGTSKTKTASNKILMMLKKDRIK